MFKTWTRNNGEHVRSEVDAKGYTIQYTLVSQVTIGLYAYSPDVRFDKSSLYTENNNLFHGNKYIYSVQLFDILYYFNNK